MAADAPPQSPSFARQAAGAAGNAAVNAAKNRAGKAAGAVASQALSKIPGGGAVGSIAKFASGDRSIGNTIDAGASGAEKIAAASGAGLPVALAIEAARLALKNKYVRYFVAGLIIVIVGTLVSSMFNTSDPFTLYSNYQTSMNTLNTISDIAANPICESSGAGASANLRGTEIAEENHQDGTPIMNDCMAAKSAAQTIAHNN